MIMVAAQMLILGKNPYQTNFEILLITGMKVKVNDILPSTIWALTKVHMGPSKGLHKVTLETLNKEETVIPFL